MDQQAILPAVHEQLRKRFGEEAVSHEEQLTELARIPYGISIALSLDLVIGRPGFPAGRLTEIVGLDAAWKSTHGFHALAACQRQGGIGILLETEAAFETMRLRELGVDPTRLIIFHPSVMEEAFEQIEAAIRLLREQERFTGPIVCVWDSIAATPVGAEAAAEYDDEQMAVHARVLAHGLRKLTRQIAKHKVVLIFINQLKQTLNPYGEKYISFGGRAIKYHATLRLEISTTKSSLVTAKDGTPVGMWISAFALKNKVGEPYRKGRYFVTFRTGIDPYHDLLQAGIEIGAVKEIGPGRIVCRKKTMFKSKWPAFVEEAGGVEAVRQRLMSLALQAGRIRPYEAKEAS